MVGARLYRPSAVSTHSRPKAAGVPARYPARCRGRFNTQPPEGGWHLLGAGVVRQVLVSTHSRPKAAGYSATGRPSRIRCFNTQPPEGGWPSGGVRASAPRSFNTQPPEGGWWAEVLRSIGGVTVSTHSRPKAAGHSSFWTVFVFALFQHTAARRRLAVSFIARAFFKRFNTQPPEGGWISEQLKDGNNTRFQHTAARRRLGPSAMQHDGLMAVSTHSRPKAAGAGLLHRCPSDSRFNTQPPEGGWEAVQSLPLNLYLFQHTAARRRLAILHTLLWAQVCVSTHSRPKAAGLRV